MLCKTQCSITGCGETTLLKKHQSAASSQLNSWDVDLVSRGGGLITFRCFGINEINKRWGECGAACNRIGNGNLKCSFKFSEQCTYMCRYVE